MQKPDGEMNLLNNASDRVAQVFLSASQYFRVFPAITVFTGQAFMH
jgi:hypothetical protein